MKSFRTVRKVAHGPKAMFDLVADVERYPQFVPMCTRLDVLSRTERDDKEIISARMYVEYGVLRENYISRITLDRDAHMIDVVQTSGPFKTLTNRWHFAPEGEGAKVTFELQYAFRSRLMQAAAGAVLDKAFGRFAEAFEKRADRIYGDPRAA